MKILNYICLLLLLQGCSGQEPLREDFIGVWKSIDGSIIEFKKEGQFKAVDIDMSKIIYDVDASKGKNLSGKWEFTIDDYGKKVLEISAEKYRFKFYIDGKGMFGSEPPWALYTFIGDPDELNKYEFLKK